MPATEVTSACTLDLRPGLVAEVVIHMEMHARPLPARRSQATDERPELAITAVKPDVEGYQRRFRHIGAPWLWNFRLRISERELASIIEHPAVEIFDLTRNGQFIGMLELDFRADGECEIAYFGVTTEAIGTGAGRFLMTHAIARAWTRQPEIRRLTVHTCTHDHPAALGFYRSSGFTPYKRSVEIYPDPRLGGTLAETDGPQIPLIR